MWASMCVLRVWVCACAYAGCIDVCEGEKSVVGLALLHVHGQFFKPRFQSESRFLDGEFKGRSQH